jgi:hypothetical protein
VKVPVVGKNKNDASRDEERGKVKKLKSHRELDDG